MSTYFFTSTASQDPLLGANWTKSDGTTGTAPDAGDDLFVQAVPGSALANIWASGGVLSAPTGLSTSGASSTGGNLAQSTNYFYKVTALSASGESLASAELSYTTPGSGTATNQITVNWSAVTGATGYKIYRSTTTAVEKLLATVGAVILYADTTATVPAGPYPASVTYASLTISQTYTGTIGNAGIGGYWEIGGATTVTIGTPAGDGSNPGGSGRIKLGLGSVVTTATVLQTSNSSSDSGLEQVRLKNTNSSSVLNVLAGRVGVATNQPGETSTLGTINVSGTNAVCNMGTGVTWTTSNVAAGGKLTTNSGSSGTLDVGSGATATCNGTALIATVTYSGTVLFNVRPAAGSMITTANAYNGGVLDCRGNPANGTITTLNAWPGATTYVNSANPGHITTTTTNLKNVGQIQYS